MEAKIKIKNRLTDLFENKKENLLNIYFTAGFPKLDDTRTIIKALEEAGADIVEIGIPFSDPMADGPTIQESSDLALKNGMTLKKLFEQLEGVRNEVQIPILLMGYVNTVMQYGIENFCRKAAEVGVDGVILPDLPMDEYNEFYKQVFENNNLSNVFLVTPNTSDKRLKLIDESTQGFIYVVSTDSTTGNNKGLSGAEDYFKRIKNSNLKNPYLIGFNIKDRETFCLASKYAHGAIIGSAFIKAIKDSKNLKEDIYKFVEGIKKD